MYAQLAASKKWLAENKTTTFILQTLIGANLIALLAQVAIPTPFVMITGQSLGVLLMGFALGRKAATAALLTYLAEGAMGLPVFAGGKAGGGGADGFIGWLFVWFCGDGGDFGLGER
nr:biotin transporter BioY [Alysiella crassa]UOP06886.1 biotin transporter BioY [Alysiella crassa]